MKPRCASYVVRRVIMLGLNAQTSYLKSRRPRSNRPLATSKGYFETHHLTI